MDFRCLFRIRNHIRLFFSNFIEFLITSLLKKGQMVVHVLVLAKLNLLAGGHGTINHLLTALVWPFTLQLPFQAYIGRPCSYLVTASTLFFFRLRRIVFEGDTGTGGRRWERTLRLVRERATVTRTLDSDEDSLRALSILSL
uniref:Uncharacterized protein n=1 Tax=Nelumbo nucifera TaxID=4432 RepID=A0A822ZRC0_NELNU|nr:TPA_asm: hypothetical protein HUJ06_017729 [Nelumbo nucifera]